MKQTICLRLMCRVVWSRPNVHRYELGVRLAFASVLLQQLCQQVALQQPAPLLRSAQVAALSFHCPLAPDVPGCQRSLPGPAVARRTAGRLPGPPRRRPAVSSQVACRKASHVSAQDVQALHSACALVRSTTAPCGCIWAQRADRGHARCIRWSEARGARLGQALAQQRGRCHSHCATA